MVICDGDAEEVFAEGVCDPELVGMPALVEEEDGGDAEGLSIRSRKCSEPSPVDLGSATGDGRQVDGVKVRRDVALGVVRKSSISAFELNSYALTLLVKNPICSALRG